MEPSVLIRIRHLLLKWFLCIGGGCGLTMMLGCQGAYFLTNPNESETVEPEYGKIDDRTLAVVVWADPSIMDEYPRSTYQVSRSVTHYLKKNLKEAKFVSPREIRDFQKQTNLDWESMDPGEIGKELDCDLVLRVDLVEFTPRASDTHQLHKARIEATLNLFECGPHKRLDPVYDDEVRITYPPGTVHGMQNTNEIDLIHQAVEHFAEVTSRKFYAHEIKLQDKPYR